MAETPLGSDLHQASQDCLRALRRLIYLRDSLVVRLVRGPRHWGLPADEKYLGEVRRAASGLWEAANRLKTRYQDAVKRNVIHSVGLVSACGVTGADAYGAVLMVAERSILAFRPHAPLSDEPFDPYAEPTLPPDTSQPFEADAVTPDTVELSLTVLRGQGLDSGGLDILDAAVERQRRTAGGEDSAKGLLDPDRPFRELCLAMGDETAAAILKIAWDGSLSVHDKMTQICQLDRRFISYKSPQWADLLHVSSPAVRETDCWKALQNSRKNPE
jgi:hypothetical protein